MFTRTAQTYYLTTRTAFCDILGNMEAPYRPLAPGNGGVISNQCKILRTAIIVPDTYVGLIDLQLFLFAITLNVCTN